MLTKIKTVLILIFVGLLLHSVYMLRVSNDAFTFENFLKKENISSSVMLLVIAIGITFISGKGTDDEE